MCQTFFAVALTCCATHIQTLTPVPYTVCLDDIRVDEHQQVTSRFGCPGG